MTCANPDCRKLTAVSIFSGMGGFELALEANGFEILCQVEIDERCRRFLHSHWPDVPQYGDIREFPAEQYRGATIVVGGPPCQPASRAGKQRGKADDRWLWGEALAVVRSIHPAWCLFENPPGIGDVGLDGILADLENQAYEVRVFGIPACAVNSPQLRNRYWIVGHSSDSERWILQQHEQPRESLCDTGGASQSHLADSLRSGRGTDSERTREGGRAFNRGVGEEGDLADTEATARIGLQDGEEPQSPSQDGRCNPDFWGNSVWLPCADGKLRRAPDDSFGVAHGLHRSVLAALGNSICWQVAYQIIKAIKEARCLTA